MDTTTVTPAPKRKKRDAGNEVEDNLPAYVHYQGNSPKVNENGNLSTPCYLLFPTMLPVLQLLLLGNWLHLH